VVEIEQMSHLMENEIGKLFISERLRAEGEVKPPRLRAASPALLRITDREPGC
jgi:hypothetical protein